MDASHADPLLCGPAESTKKWSCLSRAQYAPNLWYSGSVLQLSGTSGFLPDGEGTMSYWVDEERSSQPSSVEHANCTGDHVPDDQKFIVRYQGMFSGGKRHGKGTISTDRGLRLMCQWENDIPEVGKDLCALTTEEGDQYIGMVSIISDGSLTSRDAFGGLEWVRSVRFVPDSTGEMWIASERRRYCGEWQCGQRHGFGVESDLASSYCFSGGYQYDSREGSGTLFQTAQRTVLSGLWKDGTLHGSAALHLPNQSALIQSHSWSHIERSYDFDSATILRSRVVDGIWEPLFVAFDSTLALSVAEVVSSQQASARPSSPQPSVQSPRMTLVVSRLESILEKEDFIALLSTFQRCFYFIYGTCHRFLEHHKTSLAKEEHRTPPPPRVHTAMFPESWCCMVGLEHNACMHRALRERSYSAANLKQAVEYVASFVFSIRLRLLSYLAALPTACDLNVGRFIASMCWDVAFSAVEPLLLHMAESLCKETQAAFRVAAQRCRSLDNVSEFIGSLDLWFEEADDHFVANSSAQEAKSDAPLSTSSVLSLDDQLRLQATQPPREMFQRHLCAAVGAMRRCGIDKTTCSETCSRGTSVALRQTSTGTLFQVVPSQRIVPSVLVEDVDVIFKNIRAASRMASRTNHLSSTLGYLQDQLLTHVLFSHSNQPRQPPLHAPQAANHPRNLDALLSLACLMLSDAIDPSLPGATAVGHSRSGQSTTQEEEGAPENDSMDGHRMLSGGDATDEERQASFQSTFQILSMLQALQRGTSMWDGLRIPRWGCLISLDDLLLRIQHGVVVAIAKGDSSLLIGNDSSAGRRSSTMMLYDDEEEEIILQPKANRIVSLRSCREISAELQNPPMLGDMPPSALEIVYWLVDASSILLHRVMEGLASSASEPSGAAPVSTSEAIPSPAAPVGRSAPQQFVVKKHLKQVQVRAAVWYSDIIPRYVVISNLMSILGLRSKLEFTSVGAGASPVVPEEAYYAILKLETTPHLPADPALATFMLSSVVDRWTRSAVQVFPFQGRKKPQRY